MSSLRHDDIVPDRRVVVLRLAFDRADSKCRGLIAKSIADNSPRLDSTVAMTRHRSSSSSAAAPILPPIVISLMAPFRSFFTAPVWEHVLVLVTGMVLAPGKRTVSAALRVMGLGETRDFALYHYVLSRARWNSRAIARTLLTMILDRFVPTGPVVIGIDDTIERRWGRKIAARGIYRDPVRSSHGHFVKTSGLRWLSVMAMVPVPWTRRRWALPFLTILAPSERYHAAHGRRHKKLTDFARQAILQVRRWVPKRKIVVVADSSFAALDLIAAVRHHVCLVTRLRLDANLFAPAPKRRPGQHGRPPRRDARCPSSPMSCAFQGDVERPSKKKPRDPRRRKGVARPKDGPLGRDPRGDRARRRGEDGWDRGFFDSHSRASTLPGKHITVHQAICNGVSPHRATDRTAAKAGSSRSIGRRPAIDPRLIAKRKPRGAAPPIPWPCLSRLGRTDLEGAPGLRLGGGGRTIFDAYSAAAQTFGTDKANLGARIASSEMLLNINLLPHLICSFRASGGIGGHEAGEHDDTGRTCGGHSGPIRMERPFGKGPDSR